MNKDFWKNQQVFVTGHTGFKGTWLCLMLKRLGAAIYGYSKGYPTKPALYEQIKGWQFLDDSYVLGDILDYDNLRRHLEGINPSIVIHLAAQTIVKDGFLNPQDTFMTNIIGTGNLLNACRDLPIKAILIVTTDKVYGNQRRDWKYREDDPLGASDPYSTSKACAELITECYKKSFLQNIPIATARAGNVIGGGDWQFRVVPMIMGALMKNEAPPIWDPYAIRPWQSVLDCLSGYLRLIEFAYENPDIYTGAWNFGPGTENFYTVGEVAKEICHLWEPPVEFNYVSCPVTYNLNIDLQLDSTKAITTLGWKPKLNLDETIKALIDWYKLYKSGAIVKEICEATLDYYEKHD